MISPHSITKRNLDGAHSVRLKAFGEHHDLQLEPSDGLLTGDKLRAWTAHHNSTTDEVHYTELPNDVSVLIDNFDFSSSTRLDHIVIAVSGKLLL